jgi:hypothetical protein
MLPQAGRPPLVGCPWMLIQCIHSYPPQLETVFSISNQRTCHAVVTRDAPNMVRRFLQMINSYRSERGFL